MKGTVRGVRNGLKTNMRSRWPYITPQFTAGDTVRGSTMVLNCTRVLAAALTVLATTADAHHSLSTAYDNTRQITLTAVVREFHFVNPHPYVIVEATHGGSTGAWRLELDNRVELVEAGMTEATFKAGDRLTVTGPPSRLQANMLYVRELDRPADGFRYDQFSATPRIRRGPPRNVN